LVKKYVLIAVKAQINLRVRTYSRGTGRAPSKRKWFLDRQWCVFLQQIQSNFF